MTAHELTTLLVSGLAITLSGVASLLFSWLRDDIRKLAASVASLRQEFSDAKEEQSEIHGILKGKGIL